MKITIRLFLVLVIAGAAEGVRAEQGCGSADGWQTAWFDSEVYGSHRFEAPAGPNRFVLAPTESGWRIEVLDDTGADLAVASPPPRPLDTNPRNIAGWHFRNGDNSGPNRGEVNAPQTLRRFAFGVLSGDPGGNPGRGAQVDQRPGDRGLGELIIEDYGLADLEPGQRARMVYMKFRGCIEWDPRGVPAARTAASTPGTGATAALAAAATTGLAETTEHPAAEPGVPDRVVLRMTLCGLDIHEYRLSNRMALGRDGGRQGFLEPDLDGDGQRDIVAPVTRVADQSPGLALCLASGSRLIMAGYSGRIGRHLDPIYFGRVDWWSVYPRGSVNRSGEGFPPVLTGDGILLGKDGASSVLLYLADGVVSSYWQGD